MSTYVPLSDIVVRSLAQSTTVNSLDDKIAAAFALLPDETALDLGTVQFAVDSGAADAYVVTLTNVPASYVDGMQVHMRPANTNTGASTINVNSLGVKSIRKLASTALVASDIIEDVPTMLQYSSATGYFHAQSNSASDATASAASAAAALVSELAAAASALAAASSAASITKAVYNKTSSATLTAAEVSGFNSITNDGALAEVILTWLTLVNAQEAVFYVNDAQYLQIKAASGKKIRIGAVQTASSGYIRSNVVGNWVRIKALPDELVVTGVGGNWTYDA